MVGVVTSLMNGDVNRLQRISQDTSECSPNWGRALMSGSKNECYKKVKLKNKKRESPPLRKLIAHESCSYCASS